MARIPLTSGFTVVPEGEHIFRIYRVDYDQKFGKLTVFLVNAKGITHRENYNLMRDNGQANEGACNAFSFFAKTAMNDFSLTDIAPEELVDRYIKAQITHEVVPSATDPAKSLTFAHMGQKWPADGFDEPPVPRALSMGKESDGQSAQDGRTQAASTKADEPFDLDAWLG